MPNVWQHLSIGQRYEIMLDYTKLYTENQTIITKLLTNSDFKNCKPITNNYRSFKHKEYDKLRLDFRKVISKGVLYGYRSVSVSISPHYHINHYLHNGNDFTPFECIKTITNIFDYLGVEKSEYVDFKVVNLEVGVNITPQQCTKMIIENLLYYKKTPFKVYDKNTPYSKVTEIKSSRYKEIKAYAKGIQYPQYTDPNTMRFEIRYKKSNPIKKIGIYTLNDLVILEKYGQLATELLKEWDNTLLINPNAKTEHLNKKNAQFMEQSSTVIFWQKLIKNSNRDAFNYRQKKYFKLLQKNDDFKHFLKCKMIDKLADLFFSANCPQTNIENQEVSKPTKTLQKRINKQNAEKHLKTGLKTTSKKEVSDPLKNRINFSDNSGAKNLCKVTGLKLDLEDEKAKYIRTTTLRYLRDNEEVLFESLVNDLLSKSHKRPKWENNLITHLAKQIKNRYYNQFKYKPNRYLKNRDKEQLALFN